jgi:uncharacterized protein DUF5335
MVVTREIPPPQWRRVLDDLSRVHDGAVARLIVLDDDHGVQTHGESFRLAGLTSDGSPGRESIAVILAGSTHVTHIIDRPRSVYVERRWESSTAAVQVVDRNGIRTLISLGPPVLCAAASTAMTAPGGAPRSPSGGPDVLPDSHPCAR